MTHPRTPSAELRRALRACRRALSSAEQAAHAKAIRLALVRSGILPRARHVALYLAADGEVDTQSLLEWLWAHGKHAYLPVLRRRPQAPMAFCEYRPGDRLRPNRFGIPEPDPRRRRPFPRRGLDLVLLPLVGFDEAGNRLGMGGGYYDRTFAFLGGRNSWLRPRLIGLAHECQRVDRLAPRPWDLPLAAMVTEAGLWPASRQPGPR